MEQRTAAYCLDRKSSVRFNLRIFFDLMDIACTNSYLIYNMKHLNKLFLLLYKIVVAKNLIQYCQGRKKTVPMLRPSKRKNQHASIDIHGGNLPVFVFLLLLMKGKNNLFYLEWHQCPTKYWLNYVTYRKVSFKLFKHHHKSYKLLVESL